MCATNLTSTNPALDTFLIQVASEYSLSKSYRMNDVIFREGDLGSSMILVISGQIKIFKQGSDSTDHKEIARRGPGAFLGEMALVESSPRFATVVAATDCEVLEFSRANFEKVITEQPALATRVLRSLSSKLRESDSVRIIELEENNKLLTDANDELIRLNSFLDCVIDQSPIAIVLTTREGELFRYNKAAADMFEIDFPDTDRRINSLFKNFDFNKTRSGFYDTWHGESFGLRGRDQFPVYLSISSLSGHNNSILHLVTCQDMTDIYDLNKTKVQIEKYQAETETAAELAHDLKNYFGVLIGSTEILVNRLNDEQLKKSERILKTIDNTSNEIVTFLENMMFHHHHNTHFSCIDLETVSNSLLKFFKTQLRFNQISFLINKSDDFPGEIYILEEEIRRAMINLIVNAAEALIAHESDDKKIYINLKSSKDDSIIIEIEDNGPGIEPEYLSKMFNTKFTTKSSGHGIGLISVAKIIETHEGTISVDSKLGQGTKFIIKLPIRLGDSDA